MQPRNISRVVAGKRYRTKTARLIASDAYWDGHHTEKGGRNTFLFRTPNGNYFAQYQTELQAEIDSIVPLDLSDAISLYESLPKKELLFMFAFPGVKIEDG